MIVAPYLTRPHGESESQQHAASVPGMAHFAGTGPAGTFCYECALWNPVPDNEGKLGRVRRDAEGFLKRRRCQKYPRLMQGQQGKGVPAKTASCRHFAGHESPPEFFVDPDLIKAERLKARAAKRAARKRK